MRTKFSDRIHGTVNKNGGIISIGKPERKIPDGINGFLMQHGIDAGRMFDAGQRFSVRQIDEHLSSRNLKPAERMSVKSCLAQLNLIY